MKLNWKSFACFYFFLLFTYSKLLQSRSLLSRPFEKSISNIFLFNSRYIFDESEHTHKKMWSESFHRLKTFKLNKKRSKRKKKVSKGKIKIIRFFIALDSSEISSTFSTPPTVFTSLHITFLSSFFIR